MIPTLHLPGLMIPGQLGPTSSVPRSLKKAFTRTISRTETCSAMTTTSLMPASDASQAASAASAAGTNATLTSAPVSRTACLTESNTGTPSVDCPPRPGVTPPTTRVP